MVRPHGARDGGGEVVEGNVGRAGVLVEEDETRRRRRARRQRPNSGRASSRWTTPRTRGRAMVCFLSTRISPPTSRRGTRTASTSSSVVKRASEGSTAEADEKDEHDVGVACSARAKTRARRASDARARRRPRGTPPREPQTSTSPPNRPRTTTRGEVCPRGRRQTPAGRRWRASTDGWPARSKKILR